MTDKSDKNRGILYLCATPIGNLEDITLRVLQTLREADLVAAEDTRRTRRLLSHYDIHTPTTSYHEHNRRRQGEYLLERLTSGDIVALVSDAGTPGISDPGEDLVREAVDRGIPVVPLPGPSALLAALVVSGLNVERFVFEGFLPAKGSGRNRRLAELAGETRTVVLYEAPHRVLKTLQDLIETLGDRRACAARELTKLHEELLRDTLTGLKEHFTTQTPRGEFVLVIEGAREESGKTAEKWAATPPEEHVRLLMQEGLATNEAIKKVARLRNLPRRELYKKIHVSE
ncbi:MAG TPA: 16S rRNA (cytidine(1402)-2'-O)-methyltransferase [Desulfotomaculum sp.]|nr:MAG: methyltransferase [Peptococcaceae bacterium BRH_c8a]KJS76282.1 MAG: methyltransferase [Desulfotomaculum sp. BICA1-6]HBX24014.1 16S rRNA (cytidine(1402)-2'-O)-methyltransferase [Desulfotomaculum sp.]